LRSAILLPLLLPRVLIQHPNARPNSAVFVSCIAPTGWTTSHR
jgi:hypothetical protein